MQGDKPLTGGICPPHMGGQVQGDKPLTGGGTHEGDIDLMGEDLILIDYIIN